MPAAFPSVAVSQQTTKEVSADVVEVGMGNGYTQRVANGINFMRDHINIVWSNVSSSEYATIISFLDSVVTGDYFTWTSPLDTVQKKYILEGDRQITNNGGNVYSITQKVKQIY